MANENSLNYYLNLLESRDANLEEKCEAATEIRNNVEQLFYTQSGIFLQRLILAILPILAPHSSNGPSGQKLRRIALQVLYRLPESLLVQPYARDIVNKLMVLVRLENEENVIIIVKTISNILPQHTKALKDEVWQFLDLIQESFGSLEQLVSDTFDTPTPAVRAASTQGNPQCLQSPKVGSSDIGNEQQGMRSFKVLSECATAVGSFGLENVKGFVELIQTVLMLQAKPQKKAHAEAKKRSEVFIGISKGITNQDAFCHFISIQVKILALLEFLLRKGNIHNQLPTKFLSILPDIIVRILRDCPPKVREALFITVRAIVNYNPELRKIFLKIVDELLDEQTCVGDGLTFYETKRPLVYSTQADLIHHVREFLNLDQIRRIVQIYTMNLHDSYPGTSFQTMSAKLLFSMTECIANLGPKQDVRHIFIMILNAIGDKFAAMNRQLPTTTKLLAHCTTPAIEAQAKSNLAARDNQLTWDESDFASAMPIKTSVLYERNSDLLVDNKFLIKNVLGGLKNIFCQLIMTNQHGVSLGYTAEELKVLVKLCHEGFEAFRYYEVNEPKKDARKVTTAELAATPQEVEGEGKELLETFISIFHLVHPMTFREIFKSEVPHLCRLAGEATSPNIRSTLKKFLTDNLQPNVVPPSGLSQPVLKIPSTTSVANTLPILIRNVLEAPMPTRVSHLREVLDRYLNQHPEETCKYFAPKVKERSKGYLFGQLLAFEEAEPVREAAAQHLDLLSNFSLKEGEQGEKVQAQINAIHIAHSLCQFKSKMVITKNEPLREAIFKSGKYIEKHLHNDMDPSLRLAAEQASEQVIDLLVAYLEQEPENFKVFLKVVKAVTLGQLKQTSALFRFIYKHMIEADSSYWKAITLQCIDEFANCATSQDVKTFLFHKVVNPILINNARRNSVSPFDPQASGTELVDETFIEVVRFKLWRSDLFADATEETCKRKLESSRLELLQMTVLLQEYDLMQYANKDVMKVLWNWADLEDVISKHAALVAISYIITAYDSERFDIMKIYQALLESNQNCCRASVSQALDLLAPVLTKRMGGAVLPGLPLWVSIPKTVIAENIHNLEQLRTTLNFLIRHYNMFYNFRVHFAPLIISALHNFTQATNSVTKKLALDLINMIWLWEERAHKESPGLSPSAFPQAFKWKVDGTHTESVNDGLRLALIKNLFRFITDNLPRAAKFRMKTGLMSASPDETFPMVRLLCNFLKLPSWANVDIDIFIQRLLELALMKDPANVKQEEHAAKVIEALQVLNVILNDKPDDWIFERMELWDKLIKNLALEHVQLPERLRVKDTGEKVLDLRTQFNRILAVSQDRQKQSVNSSYCMKGVDLDKNCIKKPAPLEWTEKTVTDFQRSTNRVAVIMLFGVAIAGLTLYVYWYRKVELKLLAYIAIAVAVFLIALQIVVAQPRESTLGRNDAV